MGLGLSPIFLMGKLQQSQEETCPGVTWPPRLSAFLAGPPCIETLIVS
jgi:hypothetical protein